MLQQFATEEVNKLNIDINMLQMLPAEQATKLRCTDTCFDTQTGCANNTGAGHTVLG